MLQNLSIQNYALIDKLDIDFETGFSTITGETGAGKSIMLGAIGLLLGQRADSKAIKMGAQKCVVEATFITKDYPLHDFFEENDLEYDNNECILRRELASNGKSRAFINDTPASLAQMKELGDRLIDIHSQHQNLLLNKEEFQLEVVDIIAAQKNELDKYDALFKEYRKCSKELDEFIAETHRDKEDEDYLTFQLQQLDEAKLEAGEQTDLEKESEMLSHAEEIKENLFKVEQLMNGDESGALPAVKESLSTLLSVSTVFDKAKELAERMESSFIELKDICNEITNSQEEVDFNPERLNYVNDRLNLIYTLQQKHHVSTIQELLEIAENFRKKLQIINDSEEQIEALTKKKAESLAAVEKQAAVLTRNRKIAAKQIEGRMKESLIPLGMPNVRFEVEVSQRKELSSKGIDIITFLFTANKNGTLQNVASIASGGEIARVMLSIKALIANAVQLPTIIFDEIDTGVSGDIAERMAIIMQQMGRDNRQIISITHLPQIAALGTVQYKVYKKDDEVGTTSHIRRLTEEERVDEIAHMLSGATLTEAAVNNAKELLKIK